MLQVNDLYKNYASQGRKDEVLKGISLKVNRGEFVSVIGPSGSGKTTLLNCISGFLTADSGQVLLDGEDILNLEEDKMASVRQKKLGFVFQDFMLVDGLNVKENIYLPQIILGKDLSSIENRTNSLMECLGLQKIKNKNVNQISGGQKQRVAIARALSNKPLIILADEPTGNLDSKSSADVIDAFINAKNNLGATIFMVTHDAFAASYTDRIIALKDGKVVNQLRKKDSDNEYIDKVLSFIKGINGGDIHES